MQRTGYLYYILICVFVSADIKRFKGIETPLPFPMTNYSCNQCKTIIPQNQVAIEINGGNIEIPHCPDCGSQVVLMCERDHLCRCRDSIFPTVFICHICGKPTCQCGAHDVEVVSRITGYMSSLSGWNKAKVAEFHDRVRTDPRELF